MPELIKVPRNPLFGVTEAFTAKMIWVSADKKTVAVTSIEKGDIRRRYKTGRRDVYLLTLED